MKIDAQGTVGHKVINGAKRVTIDNNDVPVNLRVEYMSFRLISFLRRG